MSLLGVEGGQLGNSPSMASSTAMAGRGEQGKRPVTRRMSQPVIDVGNFSNPNFKPEFRTARPTHQ